MAFSKYLIMPLILLLVGLGNSSQQYAQEYSPGDNSIINLRNTGQLTYRFLSKGSIENILWSPTGKVFAVSSSAGTWLYDTSDFRKQPTLFANDHNISALAFSPDGS